MNDPGRARHARSAGLQRPYRTAPTAPCGGFDGRTKDATAQSRRRRRVPPVSQLGERPGYLRERLAHVGVARLVTQHVLLACCLELNERTLPIQEDRNLLVVRAVRKGQDLARMTEVRLRRGECPIAIGSRCRAITGRALVHVTSSGLLWADQ